MKKKYWIQTYSGHRFEYDNIKGNKVNIEEIAHALSNTCRFTGHSREFYSVAQHCVIVSKNVPMEDALWGLLHDASEAYAGDVNKPLKNKLGDSYTSIEAKIHRLIAKTFKLPGNIPMSVHLADMRLLLTERRDLFSTVMPWDGYVGVQPFDFKIKPWSPKVAKKKYLERFKYLY